MWMLLGLSAAWAANCQALAAKASTVRGEAVAPAWSALATCDPALAEQTYPEFMRATGDVESLVALSHMAIDAGIYKPVVIALESVAGARGEIAGAVGAGCEQHPNVVPFFQAAYADPKPRTFASWRDGVIACHAPALDAWLATVVVTPPGEIVSDRYATVLAAYTHHKGREAIPELQTAAVAAALNGGPFRDVLTTILDAVRGMGTVGTNLSPDERKLIEETFITIGQQVPPEAAREVGERLSAMGSDPAAAQLLPVVYADRMTSGKLLYGIAGLESCDGQTVVHYAPAMAGGTKWSVQTEAEAAVRAFKPRLKCDAGTWPVAVTPEPVRAAADVATWSGKLVTEAGDRGTEASAREEKGVMLP
ncbi:MAG: hypothetical protein H0V89_05750 [Deltaproteobacteria bacterium]|nr:hypothetical protein [Deltaproteobacteria bacterium]